MSNLSVISATAGSKATSGSSSSPSSSHARARKIVDRQSHNRPIRKVLPLPKRLLVGQHEDARTSEMDTQSDTSSEGSEPQRAGRNVYGGEPVHSLASPDRDASNSPPPTTSRSLNTFPFNSGLPLPALNLSPPASFAFSAAPSSTINKEPIPSPSPSPLLSPDTKPAQMSAGSSSNVTRASSEDVAAELESLTLSTPEPASAVSLRWLPTALTVYIA